MSILILISKALVLTYGSTPRCGVAISATERGEPIPFSGRHLA